MPHDKTISKSNNILLIFVSAKGSIAFLGHFAVSSTISVHRIRTAVMKLSGAECK